ncbi:MAG: NCS2 family permease [Candidatus Nanopelagicales bacterium]|jgi:adenine/guanine/hypoxanthine permease|nr:NCS2 family permease [Candidatus Nanopelagicales bacterium]MDP4666584.1 NCS2 family permease [Candidatus Nanopelagicales bacterium]MDP5050448.1 NCS2 family permease [Candidatus Nanopelagicales bacterium]
METTTKTTGTSAWDRYFHMSERGSNLGTEVRGGIVTFVTMAYIVVLNPLIVGTAKDINGNYPGGGQDIGTSIALVAAATALVAGIMTIFMGVYGRFPVAIAAGLGLNGFLAFGLAPYMTWAQAFGLVVIEGFIVLLLVLTGFRTAVFHAVPDSLKYSIGAGIGLFIALIGLVDAGIVRPGVPLITFAVFGELAGWPIFTFVFGLMLMIILIALRKRAAILIGLLVTTVIAVVLESTQNIGAANTDPGLPGLENPTGWGLTVPAIPDTIIGFVDPSPLFKLDLFGAFGAIGALAAGLAVFSLLLSDFFDTIGTVTGLATEADLMTADGEVEHLGAILAVDSIAAMAGGLAGTSSNTAYIESASGIGDGARTGIASLVTGSLFLLAMFIAPLTKIVPYEAAAPALVIVGFLMMTQIRHIPFDDYAIAIPSFLTIILMPFTYSITNGIGAGIVSYVAIRIAQGKSKEISALLWIIAAAFVIYFGVHPLKELFGM